MSIARLETQTQTQTQTLLTCFVQFDEATNEIDCGGYMYIYI